MHWFKYLLVCFFFVLFSCDSNIDSADKIILKNFNKKMIYDFYCQKNHDLDYFCGETDSFLINNKKCKLFVLCNFYKSSFSKFTKPQLSKCDHKIYFGSNKIIYQNKIINPEDLLNIIRSNNSEKKLNICFTNDLKNIDYHRDTLDKLFQIEGEICYTFVYKNEKYMQDTNRPLNNVPEEFFLTN